MYKEIKSYVNGVKLFLGRGEFRRYSVEIENRIGEIKYIFTNTKPTKKELQEYYARIY